MGRLTRLTDLHPSALHRTHTPESEYLKTLEGTGAEADTRKETNGRGQCNWHIKTALR